MERDALACQSAVFPDAGPFDCRGMLGAGVRSSDCSLVIAASRTYPPPAARRVFGPVNLAQPGISHYAVRIVKYLRCASGRSGIRCAASINSAAHDAEQPWATIWHGSRREAEARGAVRVRSPGYDASVITALSYLPAPMSLLEKIWWRAIHSKDCS